MHAMADPVIAPSEYAARRKKVLSALKGAAALVFAGDDTGHGIGLEPYRPHPNFEYLTGVADEPGAVLLLDPSAPAAARQEILFLTPLNRELEKWDGLRLEIGSELKKKVGVRTVLRTLGMPRFVTEAAARTKKLACLHPFSYYTQPVSPDLKVYRDLAERIPGLSIEDKTELLAGMRAKKSAAEQKMVARAAKITAEGYAAAFRVTKPGITEFDLQEAIEHAYRTNGARSAAYSTIVGAGINSTVLHYRANKEVIEDGDLICIDSGALYRGYAADVTRTIPANGVFTDRQREIYSLVLKAQAASIRACKPGAKMSSVDKAARDIINKAGYGDYFIHGIGHHLGLEVHDITPNAPLTIGAIVTIEPGVYIPDEEIGVRIEDDIVVTSKGPKNLTSMIPKSIAAIEKAMAG